MVNDFLLDLPFDLLIHILSVWVDIRSLVRTVSACCRVDLRSTLRSIIKSPAFILDHNCCSSSNSHKDKSFQWLCRYGIRSTDIVIDRGSSLADSMNYVLKCGKLIKRIRFEYRDTVNPTFISLAALHCSQLSSLQFNGCCVRGFIGDVINKARQSHSPQYAPILKLCSNLVHLNLPNCTTLTDSFLVFLAVQCSNLRTLGLHNCLLLTDQGLTKVAQLCPHVVNLDISNCMGLTDTGVNKAVEILATLQVLNCMGCNVTNSLLITISAKKAISITSLYLSGCTHITPNYINLTLKFGSYIRTLSIDLPEPTSLLLVSLKWHLFEQITTLFVQCHHLADRALLPIARHCLNLQHFSVAYRVSSCVEGPLEVLLQCKFLRTLVVGVEYSMVVRIWQTLRPDVIITHDTNQLKYNPFCTGDYYCSVV